MACLHTLDNDAPVNFTNGGAAYVGVDLASFVRARSLYEQQIDIGSWVIAEEQQGIYYISPGLFEYLCGMWQAEIPEEFKIIGFFETCVREKQALLIPKPNGLTTWEHQIDFFKHGVYAPNNWSPESLRPVVVCKATSLITTQSFVCGNKLIEVYVSMVKSGGFVIKDITSFPSLVTIVPINADYLSEDADPLAKKFVSGDNVYYVVDTKRVVAAEMLGLPVCGVVYRPNDPLPPDQRARFRTVVEHGITLTAETYADAVNIRLRNQQIKPVSVRPSIKVAKQQAGVGYTVEIPYSRVIELGVAPIVNELGARFCKKWGFRKG